ncbi:MAG: manganese efflux pump [Oscillospiraceae bacterium]|nr:manganese efflux pump [Oscillospiraceae bacterium]
MNALFFFNSILLGVGLAMDAFSVSVANALNEPNMRLKRECAIAGTFAGFQFLMPMLGWICVHTLVEHFTAFQRYIPWIALALLLWIGGSMLREGIRGGEEEKAAGVGFAALMLQGVATSIDALSVGFTIAEYDAVSAFVCSLIIAVVTFAICMAGLRIGRAAGARLAGKAGILGGVILIFIGLEIFVKGVILK